jgi:hypothetical protein
MNQDVIDFFAVSDFMEHEVLRPLIKRLIQDAECEKGESDKYGQQYTVDIEIERGDMKAMVKTGWIVNRNEIHPRLTTCFVK